MDARPIIEDRRNHYNEVRRHRSRMRVLIYKRTHTGDPCKCGVFGVHDCMGRIREWNYDAVLGIGAKTAPKTLTGRLTWVGISRQRGDEKYKRRRMGKRGPVCNSVFTFMHFHLMNDKGPSLDRCAPCLQDYMDSRGGYGTFILGLSASTPSMADIRREVKALIDESREQKASFSKSGECCCHGAKTCGGSSRQRPNSATVSVSCG